MRLLSFIILSWNSGSYLSECLNSIAEKCLQENLAFEVIAVDNGSTDGSVETLRSYNTSDSNHFKLIALEKNHGTTYSRNLALKAARGSYLCVLDSDTELGQGRITEMLELLDTNQAVGLIAPQLLLPDGTIQNSVKRFPTLWHKLLKVARIFFGLNITNLDFYEDFPFHINREVDTAISACWVFRRDLLEKVGYLDEKIFYSPEDLDYCRRVKAAGFTIFYWASFTVLHHTQQISHRKPFSKVAISHLLGLFYYYRKHGGWLLRPVFKDHVQ